MTGAGRARLRVHVPRGTYVGTREPLMPFEARGSTAKATGGRIIRAAELSSKQTGKKRWQRK